VITLADLAASPPPSTPVENSMLVIDIVRNGFFVVDREDKRAYRDAFGIYGDENAQEINAKVELLQFRVSPLGQKLSRETN